MDPSFHLKNYLINCQKKVVRFFLHLALSNNRFEFIFPIIIIPNYLINLKQGARIIIIISPQHLQLLRLSIIINLILKKS